MSWRWCYCCRSCNSYLSSYQSSSLKNAIVIVCNYGYDAHTKNIVQRNISERKEGWQSDISNNGIHSSVMYKQRSKVVKVMVIFFIVLWFNYCNVIPRSHTFTVYLFFIYYRFPSILFVNSFSLVDIQFCLKIIRFKLNNIRWQDLFICYIYEDFFLIEI